jgi:toxin ParE1/3/4
MLHLHEEARSEFFRATDYYAEVSPRLAERFIVEVEGALSAILSRPFQHRVYRNGYRVRLLKKFKFSIFYKIQQEDVFVLAIYHQARQPDRWIKRDT